MNYKILMGNNTLNVSNNYDNLLLNNSTEFFNIITQFQGVKDFQWLEKSMIFRNFFKHVELKNSYDHIFRSSIKFLKWNFRNII